MKNNLWILYFAIFFITSSYFYGFDLFTTIFAFFYIVFLMYRLDIEKDKFIFLLGCFTLHFFYWMTWEANVPPIFFFFTIFFILSLYLKKNKDLFGIFWTFLFLFIFYYFK